MLLVVMSRFKLINFFSLQYHMFSDDLIFYSWTCTFTINFDQNSFPLEVSPFQVSLLQNSTNSSLIDGAIHIFKINLLLLKSFLESVWFVARYFSFFKQTVLVVFPDYSFVTTNSLSTLFFIYLQIVAVEYFQYDVIFDISEYFSLHL